MGKANKSGKHPLARVRESLGLSGIGLARLAGTNYHRVFLVEMGLSDSLSWRIRKALRDQGVDVEQLDVEIIRWRMERLLNQEKTFKKTG